MRNRVFVGDREEWATTGGLPRYFVYLGDRKSEKLGDLLLHSSQ
ncbi:hypothetical protein QUB60_10620 [Microcoleus sp. A2-C5]